MKFVANISIRSTNDSFILLLMTEACCGLFNWCFGISVPSFAVPDLVFQIFTVSNLVFWVLPFQICFSDIPCFEVPGFTKYVFSWVFCNSSITLCVMTRFMWRLVSWFAMQISWLVSAWYGFLIRCFFIRVALIMILNYNFLVSRNLIVPMIYSEIPLGRDSFSFGDRAIDNW